MRYERAVPSLCVKLTVTLLPPAVWPPGRVLPQPVPEAAVGEGVAEALTALFTEVLLAGTVVLEVLLSRRAPQIPLLA